MDSPYWGQYRAKPKWEGVETRRGVSHIDNLREIGYNGSMKCEYCNKQFVPYEWGDGRQRFCSTRCQYKGWTKRNPERAREIRLRSKEKHRATRRQYGRKYYTLNRERMRENLRRWRRKHRALVVQQALRYQRRVRELPGDYTLEEWENLKKQCRYRCAICGEKKKLTRDHIIPVTNPKSRNDISNIQPLCLACNSRKFNHVDAIKV